MKVLILSGRFGFGHEMAANAIREELERQEKNVEVIQKDLLGHFFPRASQVIYKLFGLVAERCHKIYNLVCKVSDRINSGEGSGGGMICRRFQKMMEEYMPDVIVCTHPFCEKAAAAYKIKTDSRIPLVTCITDISVRMEWFSGQTDIYLVPAKEIKDHMIGLGIVPEHILVTGVPVRQQFLSGKNEDGAGKAKISEGAGGGFEKQVLLMGGGLGIMPELEEILYTLHGMAGVSTTVVTGKNQKLYERWKGYFDDVEVLGYVEDISSYTRRADLVISKAGGVTLFELIHSKVPMFVIRPFMEQEITNARYAQEKGFARVIWGEEEDYRVELQSLLKHPGELKKMKTFIEQAHQDMMDTELSEAVRVIVECGQEYLLSFGFANINRYLLDAPVLRPWAIAGQVSKPV